MIERSYGIIPVSIHGKKTSLLFVQHYSGHWAFPKGHPEPGETAKQAAERELQEETGLTTKDYLSEKEFLEEYFFTFKGKRIHKIVTYFLAEVKGHIKVQKDEVKAVKWVQLHDAENYATYPAAKSLCAQVKDLLHE